MIKYPYFIWEVKNNFDEKINKGRILYGKPILSICIDSLPLQNNKIVGLSLKRFSEVYSEERNKVVTGKVLMNKLLSTILSSAVSRCILKLVKL